MEAELGITPGERSPSGPALRGLSRVSRFERSNTGYEHRAANTVFSPIAIHRPRLAVFRIRFNPVIIEVAPGYLIGRLAQRLIPQPQDSLLRSRDTG